MSTPVHAVKISFGSVSFEINRAEGSPRVFMTTRGEDFGPLHRALEPAEREQLFKVLGFEDQADKLATSQLNEQRLHERMRKMEESIEKLIRALRLLRDFTNHATKWLSGCRLHPIWAMIADALGAANKIHPDQTEWMFLWPENKRTLEEIEKS